MERERGRERESREREEGDTGEEGEGIREMREEGKRARGERTGEKMRDR